MTTYAGPHGDVTTFGVGPEVVFLSNPLADAHWWTEGARGLLVEAGHAVTVLEHRAASDDWQAVVASVARFVDERPEPVTLVGWSLGATIAQEVALARPDRVRAAVLLATYGRQNEIDRIYQDCWTLLANGGDDLDPLRLALGLLTAHPPARLADDELVGFLRDIQPEWAGRPDPDARRRAAGYIASYQDRLEALAGITRPCLVLGFELDTDTFAARAREVAEAIPGARHVEVAGAGHLAPVTHADQVWPVVLEFIASHP